MLVQIKKIDIEKWCEGVRIDADPGVEFVLNWIKENGATFKELWKKSCCKDCIHGYRCGHEVVEECELFDNGNGQMAE